MLLKLLIEHKIFLEKSDKLVLLGDYIDRGKQSKEVVDYIIELINEGFDIIPLIGNHEAMLLEALENEKYLSRWIQNDGQATLNSFGITSLKELEQRYLSFFRGLPYYFEYGEFLFVHAGFNDKNINPFEDKYSMLWECKREYNNPIFKGKTIIHGHRPISVVSCKERVLRNREVIDIDTGIVYSGKNGYNRLTALELNTRSLYFA